MNLEPKFWSYRGSLLGDNYLVDYSVTVIEPVLEMGIIHPFYRWGN